MVQIDTNTVSWAIQKLGGVSTPANAAYAAYELEHQLKDSGASAIFTCAVQLEVTLTVTRKLGLPDSKVFLIDVPPALTGGKGNPKGFKTVDDLINQGKSAPSLEPLKWSKGQGARQCGFLCYSSGTSGLPKGVMISHRNVIANTLQVSTFDSYARNKKHGPGFSETVLGLLPFSHIYGLIVISHVSLCSGDAVIVLPRFEMQSFLTAIQTYKMTKLYLVPPIVIAMVNNKKILDKFDLSSITGIFCGAAPLGPEVIQKLGQFYPEWDFIQGYGLTETCTVVTSTSTLDILHGSVGSILPGFEVRLVTVEGQEITGYDQPGELWARSPSVVLGYLNNETANKETFVDGYMRTGDEAVRRKGPNGHDHWFIVDRIKELIKVKGMQVAPAELEAHLLSHPAVADCAVIAIPDDRAGERPKAFVVKSANSGGIEDSEQILKREIKKHVEKTKAQHKWLAEVEFIGKCLISTANKHN